MWILFTIHLLWGAYTGEAHLAPGLSGIEWWEGSAEELLLPFALVMVLNCYSLVATSRHWAEIFLCSWDGAGDDVGRFHKKLDFSSETQRLFRPFLPLGAHPAQHRVCAWTRHWEGALSGVPTPGGAGSGPAVARQLRCASILFAVSI